MFAVFVYIMVQIVLSTDLVEVAIVIYFLVVTHLKAFKEARNIFLLCPKNVPFLGVLNPAFFFEHLEDTVTKPSFNANRTAQ